MGSWETIEQQLNNNNKNLFSISLSLCFSFLSCPGQLRNTTAGWNRRRRHKDRALQTEEGSVWPGWAIYWTLGHSLKPLAAINLPKSPTFLGIFCKGVKIYHFSSEIIFGQLLWTIGTSFLVTLGGMDIRTLKTEEENQFRRKKVWPSADFDATGEMFCFNFWTSYGLYVRSIFTISWVWVCFRI